MAKSMTENPGRGAEGRQNAGKINRCELCLSAPLLGRDAVLRLDHGSDRPGEGPQQRERRKVHPFPPAGGACVE